ncbi:hypothetical protein SAMN05421734_10313 [Pelagirhabdus alkalitolerans]|uniref:Nuclease-related domain-containing protein n=1 Tax=Pelagirhabdus alkalitolerans TaxID=1612202 RepID=A0A1G6HI12_9BACI|nr:NERD domain-containing protein [Pelagirhabdus alkalitolerans]SDB93872.1 hypothetical protein SAMN05421734_10313 [Pelagirhabdus alkalitolerans]
MAQLIKLENYISRYQRDIFHYPGQYIRLKQANWQSVLNAWELQKQPLELEDPLESDQDQSILSKWKSYFNKRESIDEAYDEPQEVLPQTEEQLKHYFLDSLYSFQLNWASSTINEMSFLDRLYQDDLTLKYFMQRFPDTFLFMYNPIFKLKKATVDLDIILIKPTEINLIKLVERPSTQSIIVGDERTWFTEENNVQTKFMSPMVSLQRSDKIIKSILTQQGLEMPIKKLVLSRTNPIGYISEPYQTHYIGRDLHEDWLQAQRNELSPLKHHQLKVAETLLNFTDTVSVYRPEWDRDESDDFTT